MGYSCEVVADSISMAGARLTTLAVTYPRIVLAEFNTHRMFSRNTASSRAIPIEKRIQAVLDDPFVPPFWGTNRPGMQAGDPVDDGLAGACEMMWLEARDRAVIAARRLQSAGVHKGTVNRLIEPFSWVTTLVTATEWRNFLAQRRHRDAQPEFQLLASNMGQVLDELDYDELTRRVMAEVAELVEASLEASEPVLRHPAERGASLVEGATVPDASAWHLPWVTERERGSFELDDLLRLSVARCARVSYLNHDKKYDVARDFAVYDKMRYADPPHWSPFEHQAVAMPSPYRQSGNFVGWAQFRKSFIGESGA